jgi:PAS domain S-box-containing protein
MEENAKTREQLLIEMEELRRRLDASGRGLQEANEILRAEVAERKRAEKILAEAQKYAESIVETIHQPLVVLTPDLRVISANPSFYQTFEVSPEETTGSLIYSIDNGQWDIPALRELLEEIIPNNFHFDHFEIDHKFPAIGRKKLLLNARRIYQEGKGTDRILLALEDITERKQTEEALKISEVRYRRLFETAQDGILILDADTGEILDVNPFLIEILRYTSEDFLGRKLWEIGVFKDVERSKAAFLELQSKGYIRYENLPLETREGQRINVEFVSNVYSVNHKKVIQCNIRDITKRRQVEEALAERTVQLERMNQELVALNADLDDFTRIASHDLQEPLQTLTAYSDLLREDLGQWMPEQAGKDLVFLTEAAKRMQTLIRDLLALSRAGRVAKKREKVSLRECADLALEALAIRVKETRAEVMREELPDVWGDSTLLAELYQNLIGNALKFSGDRPPIIQLTFEERDGDKIFGVKDNGIGINPKYAQKIFEPFRRLHGRAEYEGAGIGLAICRKIVERHGGKIWVDSAPGKGAHFRFTILRRMGKR